MQSAQEFIEAFLHEKTEQSLSSWQTYQQLCEKFFAKDIIERRSKWREEQNKNPESVSIIEITDDSASFITDQLIFKHPRRQRYHMRLSKGKWEIYKEETECFFCKGTGQRANNPCHVCGGIGWKDYSRELPDK